MVKTVIVEFDDIEHSEMLLKKGNVTWRDVVRAGLDSLYKGSVIVNDDSTHKGYTKATDTENGVAIQKEDKEVVIDADSVNLK